MSINEVTIHARYITSDFDAGARPGHLFDSDPRESTYRAYRRLLREIRKISKKEQSLNWRLAAAKLRPALQRIARNYWRDFDFDDRKKSAQIKVEAKKLIGPLNAVIEALEDRAAFVRHGLNYQASSAIGDDARVERDHFTAALDSNKVLFNACCAFVARDHRKEGGAIRFENAARDLCSVWEDIFGRRFPRNRKMGRASDRDIANGVRRKFENPAADFVFLAILEIGNPSATGRSWVKASQIEEALAAVFRGK